MTQYQDINALDITTEGLSFYERVSDRLQDILKLKVFDYKVGYDANLTYELRGAKQKIHAKFDDAAFAKQHAINMPVPEGLQGNLMELALVIQEHHKAVYDAAMERGKYFVDIIDEVIHNRISYDGLEIKQALSNDINIEAVRKQLDKSYVVGKHDVASLFGNATRASKLAIIVSDVADVVINDQIRNLHERVEELEVATRNLRTAFDDDNAMLEKLRTHVKQTALTYSIAGEMIYITIELSKAIIKLGEMQK